MYLFCLFCRPYASNLFRNYGICTNLQTYPNRSRGREQLVKLHCIIKQIYIHTAWPFIKLPQSKSKCVIFYFIYGQSKLTSKYMIYNESTLQSYIMSGNIRYWFSNVYNNVQKKNHELCEEHFNINNKLILKARPPFKYLLSTRPKQQI